MWTPDYTKGKRDARDKNRRGNWGANRLVR